MTEFINEVTTEEKMLAEIQAMNACGIRLTGSAGHKAFIKNLQAKIRAMGLDYYTDPYRFNRWEESSKSLAILSDDGEENIHISSSFPYSGETPDEGIEAELAHIGEKHIGFIGAKDKIAVVHIDELDFLPSTLAFHKRRSIPEDLNVPEKYNGPVATAFVNFPFLQVAKDSGCAAVICVWRGMSDEMTEGQYLPFILDYQGIPAIWLNATEGERVIKAADEHKTARLTLTADREFNCSTETFYSIIEGEKKDEAIIINTHTDGVNCIEENGAITMLAMMDYFRKKVPSRTLIFVFVTGHFRLPRFKSNAGGGVQATSKWLAAHPDLWDGKNGHIKAVASVGVEHLGCRRFKTVDGEYKEVGDTEIEMVYTGNKQLDDVYYKALEGRERVNTITMRGHNFLHFGEGQPPMNVGIPDISLCTAPDCLTVISDSHEIEKFDISLMYEQSDTFIKIVNILLGMTKEEIGSADGYSLVFPNGEPFVYRAAKKLIFNKKK